MVKCQHPTRSHHMKAPCFKIPLYECICTHLILPIIRKPLRMYAYACLIAHHQKPPLSSRNPISPFQTTSQITKLHLNLITKPLIFTLASHLKEIIRHKPISKATSFLTSSPLHPLSVLAKPPPHNFKLPFFFLKN